MNIFYSLMWGTVLFIALCLCVIQKDTLGLTALFSSGFTIWHLRSCIEEDKELRNKRMEEEEEERDEGTEDL